MVIDYAYEDTRQIGRWPPRVPKSDSTAIVARATDDFELVYLDSAGVQVITANALKSGWVAPQWSGFAVAGGWGQYEQQYAAAYIACVWANRAIDIRARKVADVLRKGRVIDKSTRKAVPDHPLLEAIRRARIHFKQDVFNLWAYNKLIYGESFVEKVSGQLYRMPFCVRVLNSLAVEPMVNRGRIDEFWYAWDDGSTRFLPDQLVYDKYYNPADDYRGLSKLSSALASVGVENQLLLLNSNFLKNNARPGIILSPKLGTSIGTSMEELVVTLKEDIKGVQNAGKPLVMRQPFDVTVAEPPKFEDTHELGEDMKRRVCAAVGVPVPLVDFEQAAFQLSPQQMFSLYDLTIMPDARDITAAVDVEILPFFDESGQHCFELPEDEIYARLEDPTVRVSNATAKFGSGAYLVNEYRQSLGDSPLPDGDVLMLPAGVIFKSPETAFQPAPLVALPAEPTAIPPQPVPDPAIGEIRQIVERIGKAVEEIRPNPPAPEATPEQTEAKPKTYAVLGYFDRVGELVKMQETIIGMIGARLVESNQHFETTRRDEFHVTLIHAECAPERIREKLALHQQSCAITVDGVGVFDTPDGFAVHLTIRNEGSGLFALQSALAAEADGELSDFSKDWKPHITLGYLPFAVEPFSFTPFALLVNRLELSGDDHQPIMINHLKAQVELPDDDPLAAIKADLLAHKRIAQYHESPLDELAAWEKKARNKGAKAIFQTYLIRDEMAEGVRLALDEAGENREAVRAVFANARLMLSYKAIQATRIDFEDAFEDMLREAMAGKLTRRRWGTIVRSLISRYGNMAYRDGLVDGGVDDEPDEAGSDRVAEMIRAQSQYVTALGERLFKDEDTVTPAMADEKPSMWWNKSMLPFYTAGLADANGNQLMEFGGEDGEESCITCQVLKGQRHRLKDWIRRGLVPGQDTHNFDCGGWHCAHLLIAASGRARGNWLNAA